MRVVDVHHGLGHHLHRVGVPLPDPQQCRGEVRLRLRRVLRALVGQDVLEALGVVLLEGLPVFFSKECAQRGM